MSILTSEIATKLNGSLSGNPDLLIHDGKSIQKAGPEEITFVGDKKNVSELNQTKAIAVLVSDDLKEKITLAEQDQLKCIIYVPDAQSAMIELLQILRPRKTGSFKGISDLATVHETAIIGNDTEIHPGAIIEAGVTMGQRCRILPGVHIGLGCQLGDDVTLYSNVVLYDDISLGDRVSIHSSAVIGADGFGYRLVNGKHKRIPHFGGVRIGNDVEIGSCTTVDRGMIEDTVIGEGTKLDNQVMIAHNCELGKHNIMVSQVGLAGSVTTGDYVVCAGGVGVADHLHLGTQSVIGSKAAVHRNVPDGETQLGYPAEPVERAMRIVMAQKKLPEMRKDLRALQKQVKAITEKMEQLEKENIGNKGDSGQDITSAA